MPPSDPRLAAISEGQWVWCIAQAALDKKLHRNETRSHIASLLYAVAPDRAQAILDIWRDAEEDPEALQQRIRMTMAQLRALRERPGGTAGRDEETLALLKDMDSGRLQEWGDDLDGIDTQDDMIGEEEPAADA